MARLEEVAVESLCVGGTCSGCFCSRQVLFLHRGQCGADPPKVLPDRLCDTSFVNVFSLILRCLCID